MRKSKEALTITFNEHDDEVLEALNVADYDLIPVKINITHP